MSKILIVKGIKKCYECPYFKLGNIAIYQCDNRIIDHERAKNPAKFLINANSMPDWCPLPDEQDVSRETITKPETD